MLLIGVSLFDEEMIYKIFSKNFSQKIGSKKWHYPVLTTTRGAVSGPLWKILWISHTVLFMFTSKTDCNVLITTYHAISLLTKNVWIWRSSWLSERRSNFKHPWLGRIGQWSLPVIATALERRYPYNFLSYIVKI